jgi:acyl dehydratase
LAFSQTTQITIPTREILMRCGWNAGPFQRINTKHPRMNGDSAMIEVETPADLEGHLGEVLGRSEWIDITQANIDIFGEVTGDDQWIHVDPERAAREMPDGKTIAHGLYVVGLIPRLQRECYQIRKRGLGLNYGYDRIRFVAPVQSGTRVRLAITLEAIETNEKETRIITKQVIEREGEERPAVVTNHILLIFND